MIAGRFGNNGELLFEIELISRSGESFSVEVLLDTGFTTGFLAINFQDLEILEWPLIRSRIKMTTARGDEFFDLYEGTVIIDRREYVVPIYVGDELPEILMGAQWLEMMRLIIDKSKGILTLERANEPT